MTKEQTAAVSERVPIAELPSAVASVARRLGFATARTMVNILRDSIFRVNTAKGDRPFTDTEIAACMCVADEYRLNPLTKEIYLTRSRGKLLVIVPIDGWVKVVNARKSFDGVEFEWTDKEDGTPFACTCMIHDKERGRPFRVTEYYDECFMDTEPWKKWPRRMLRHKAYIQCARVAYGLSGIIDEDEAQRFNGMREPEYTVRESGPGRTAADLGREMERHFIDEPKDTPQPEPKAEEKPKKRGRPRKKKDEEPKPQPEPEPLVKDDAPPPEPVEDDSDPMTPEEMKKARWELLDRIVTVKQDLQFHELAFEDSNEESMSFAQAKEYLQYLTTLLPQKDES